LERADYWTQLQGAAEAPLQWPVTEHDPHAVALPLHATKLHVPFEQVCVVQVSVEHEPPFCPVSGVDVHVPSPRPVVELPPHAACWHAPGVTLVQVGSSATVPSVSTSR
jgi:hypothetical protein